VTATRGKSTLTLRIVRAGQAGFFPLERDFPFTGAKNENRLIFWCEQGPKGYEANERT
jgi:hypothetical protein